MKTLKKSKLLSGITRRKPYSPPVNPSIHSPLAFHNRVEVELWSPGADKPKQRVESVGNILCTWGLNQLIEQITAGTEGFAAPWIQCAVIGTSATVYVSTDDSVKGATASKSMGASMVASDTGSMSMQYRITFDDANAYTANEVGLMGSNVSTASMVAAKSFAAPVVKAAADTINVTYTIIAGTA